MDTRNRVSVRGETLVTGIVAWLALNAFTYAFAPLFGISFGTVSRFFGSILFPGSAAAVQAWAGRALFLGAAIGWSLVYRWARVYLSGPGWLRGLVFGTGVWVTSALVLPLFGAMHPLNGGGFPTAPSPGGVPYPCFFGLGFDGGAGVALSLIGHQVFGATLGAVSGRRNDRG
jgi:hypothetical protein